MRIIILFFTSCVCLSTQAETPSVYFKYDTFGVSEPMAIYTANKDWSGIIHYGDQIYSRTYQAFGFQKKHFTFEIFDRSLGEAEMSPGFVKVLQLALNQENFTIDQSYVLAVTTGIFESKGFRYGHRFHFDNLEIELGLSYLIPDKITVGSLNGEIVPADDGFELNYSIDYLYDQDMLYGRETQGPWGVGYSTDLKLTWEKPRLQIVVQDLVGAIHWSEVPYTSGETVSDISLFGDLLQPNLQGTVGYKDYIQSISPLLSISYRCPGQWRQTSCRFGAQQYKDLISQYVGLSYQLYKGSELFGDMVYSNVNMIRLGVSYKQWQANFYTDNFESKQARSQGVFISYHHSPK